ncbi:hypothetical protein GCM10011609_85800 [Lentzea pudingi]|uniref:Glycosyltransferase, catalytic subunit of cellulose synthase and poly-beta-1,6-N-acetylglucosamine synthase n=1 Tax=Lentzea pudingi TaxID=1789439 RepID=A0ABQ2IVV9_9PSEU|nr:glycosyltransferase family 2 protein [Lentzea pudingi]GGN29038.1 hypothetical protein GCM10011609_85800 [Lentzea pudingi]
MAVVLGCVFVSFMAVGPSAAAQPAPVHLVQADTAPTDQLFPPAPADPFGVTAPERAVNVPGQADATSSWPDSALGIAGAVLLVLVSLALTVVAGTTLWWMLHAWRTPASLLATGFSRRSSTWPRSFSLIVPARHEQQVLADTLDTLALLDHPDYEVLAVIGHDDPETEAVARAAAQRHPAIIRVLIDHNTPKNKPKALNTALADCRGDITGVFDAEDDVHRDLLKLVEARFDETGADVVQAGVQLMNIHTTWWSLRNCLEYYFWFRSRLHFHAEQRFIPLGGNTVFTRTDLLREHGGWDPECLAEDCEIGVRLSSAGAVVAVAYDPEVVTREETPDTITSLVKQRTRWDQGFLQVLGKGEWRRLPGPRQRMLARYTLAMPFLQAFTGVMILIAIVVMLTAKVPTAITLLTFLPLVPTLVTIAVEMVGLGEFAKSFGMRARPLDYLRLVLGTFPYQMLLAFAAVRSVWRQARGDGSWEKTSHANVHRTITVVDDDLVTAGAAR